MPGILKIELGPDRGLASMIINRNAPDVPVEVKEALADYAMGNPGAASVLSKLSMGFTTAKQVEDLVGWPLSEHNMERTGEIWNRFRHS